MGKCGCGLFGMTTIGSSRPVDGIINEKETSVLQNGMCPVLGVLI